MTLKNLLHGLVMTLSLAALAASLVGWARRPSAPGSVSPQAASSGRPAMPVVCIDPGHPSETSSGRTVQNGITELEINWVVALQLRDRLEDQAVRVVMTKGSRDERVTNRRRSEIANQAGAALLFRIHCDRGAGRGITTYYPARPGEKNGLRGPPPEVIKASGRAARRIHAVMARRLPSLRDNGVKTDRQTAVGRRQGALTGSIFARVPVVLVEMVFLSHPRDAAFIKSRGGQRQMVEAMTKGILAYLQETGRAPRRR